MIENELFKRALAQKVISTADAKRFTETQLNSLVISDSINGIKPKSLFKVDESIADRVKLQGGITPEDLSKCSRKDREELQTQGFTYQRTGQTPTIHTNKPKVTREQFENMSPGEKRVTLDNRVPIVDALETKEFDFNQVINILSRGADDE